LRPGSNMITGGIGKDQAWAQVRGGN
jgi:hypothetical protein